MLLTVTTFISLIVIETILLKVFIKKNWICSFIFCIIANICSILACLVFVYIISLVIKIISSFSEVIAIILYILNWLALPVIIIWTENAVYKKCWKDISKDKLLSIVIAINITTYISMAIFFYVIQEKRNKESFERLRQISCTSNLKQIGLSLKQYANDYNGFLPDKGLEQLRINDYLTDYGVYVCPRSGTPQGKENQKLTEKNLDYIYRSGLKFNAKDAKTPLVWDKPTNHENYGNVLFLDGHVKGFEGANWMEQAGIKKTATRE